MKTATDKFQSRAELLMRILDDRETKGPGYGYGIERAIIREELAYLDDQYEPKCRLWCPAADSAFCEGCEERKLWPAESSSKWGWLSFVPAIAVLAIAIIWLGLER